MRHFPDKEFQNIAKGNLHMEAAFFVLECVLGVFFKPGFGLGFGEALDVFGGI